MVGMVRNPSPYGPSLGSRRHMQLVVSTDGLKPIKHDDGAKEGWRDRWMGWIGDYSGQLHPAWLESVSGEA